MKSEFSILLYLLERWYKTLDYTIRKLRKEIYNPFGLFYPIFSILVSNISGDKWCIMNINEKIISKMINNKLYQDIEKLSTKVP